VGMMCMVAMIRFGNSENRTSRKEVFTDEE
jgi:hypothetical protein